MGDTYKTDDDSGTFGITGLPRPADAEVKTKTIPYVTNLPLRYEISEFASSKDKEVRKQWTLFILALEKFKNKSVDEKLSYFQVAGIHGYPETVWDNAPPPKPDPVNPGPGDQPYGGYCNHNGLNFPTWHRPYMLLFEQCIWDNMKDIIKHWTKEHGLSDPDAKLWYDAAKKWRMPYWDWARKQVYAANFALPQVLTQGSVRIYPPAEVKGLQATGIGRYGIFVNNDQGFRGLEGVNNSWVANATIAAPEKQWYTPENFSKKGIKWNPGTLADAVNRMYSPQYNTTWGEFASTKWVDEGNANTTTGYLSLEYIHNNVHNFTGGQDLNNGLGQMSDVPVAAFDPVFWLHHTQIDRLLAIWQSLYWDLWWDKKEPGTGNVKDDTPDEPLQPFHDKNNGDPLADVWTANKCRDWTNLNYQYDDLMALSQTALLPDGTLDEAKFKSDLQVYINRMYPATGHLVQSIRAAPDVNTPEGLAPDSGEKDAPGATPWKDYIINVVYDRYALAGRAYTIEFFLGGPENKPKTIWERQNRVGHVFTFGGGVRSSEDSCANCKTQKDAGVLSCAQVPLTIQLLHHALDHVADHPITSFLDEEVEEYLKLHLNWRFIQAGGAEVEADQFPNTTISVLRGTGKPRTIKPAPAEKGLFALEAMSLEAPSQVSLTPEYYDYEVIPSITKGKQWGAEAAA
ncbi:hypothetical protein EDB81DRAFT_698386 [Dactylonectria macrodidyma]|uniref:tyrosinase n=1 Tax=Dactylonectria macrodidyma TaxID=307937 RepID=A0A9P9IMH5_9HYPO|nr:hypothetical protein EDB81DRAFT_698386 [Dactylonectria macrodidyma]